MRFPEIPALQDAIVDQQLRGEPLRVYVALLQRLDWRGARYLKVRGLAHYLGVAPSTVSDALRLLDALGYVERIAVDGRSAAWRLHWARDVRNRSPQRTNPRDSEEAA